MYLRSVFLPLLLSTGLWGSPSMDHGELSEMLGHLLARHLDSSQFEINIERFMEGIRHEQAGLPAPMSEEDYETAMLSLSQSVFEEQAQSNLAIAENFLKEKQEDPTIHTMVNDKLLYQLNQPGQGEAVRPGDVPLIHVHGTLLDGSVFASSRDSAPCMISLEQAIPGFSQGIIGMQEGEKRTLYIHPELAYGTEGYLPPNSLLIFEVELLQRQGTPQDLVQQEKEHLPPTG